MTLCNPSALDLDLDLHFVEGEVSEPGRRMWPTTRDGGSNCGR